MYPILSTPSMIAAATAAALSCVVLPALAQRATGEERRQIARPRARPVSWSEVRAIVDRLHDALPPDLRDAPPSQQADRWTEWTRAQRKALTVRLATGDMDSVVNLLLFGSSFTKQPRVTLALLADLNRRWASGDASAQQQLTRAYRQRALDLVAAASEPDADERMQFVRRVLQAHGIDLAAAARRDAAVDHLLANVVRVRKEAAALATRLDELRAGPDATAAFAERSRIFRDRGLSADSSVLTQFAVDRALCALAAEKLLAPRAVAHVAIVGPGLDFADKQEGFDFYAPQTLQPFTALDSLSRCGLASPGVRVTTIDVSTRVNDHIRDAVQRAASNRAYRLVLPWDSRAGWLDDAVAYWKQAGDRIGAPAAVTPPAPLPAIWARAVAVRSDAVRRLDAIDASIVTDRIDVAGSRRFDLVITTNVLVYYDTFEQTLALASIAAMLRPGGVLLTNDAVLEIPEVPLRSSGSLAVPFSARAGDGERMIWYVRGAQ
jgi:hypothetical protein